LAVYASVDAEKALVRQRELKSLEESSVGNGASALNLKSDSWRAYFNDRQTAADQLVKVALPLIETEPDRALALVVQSLQGGTVSGALFEVVEKLIKNGNRALLDRLETNISQALATTVTLDPTVSVPPVFSALIRTCRKRQRMHLPAFSCAHFRHGQWLIKSRGSTCITLSADLMRSQTLYDISFRSLHRISCWNLICCWTKWPLLFLRKNEI
jgi:hypothetical protein